MDVVVKTFSMYEIVNKIFANPKEKYVKLCSDLIQ